MIPSKEIYIKADEEIIEKVFKFVKSKLGEGVVIIDLCPEFKDLK